jgi:hypothetical protein
MYCYCIFDEHDGNIEIKTISTNLIDIVAHCDYYKSMQVLDGINRTGYTYYATYGNGESDYEYYCDLSVDYPTIKKIINIIRLNRIREIL